MLAALLIISSLSLLVATEAEPTSSPVDVAPEPPPVLPKRRMCCDKGGDSDQLAA